MGRKQGSGSGPPPGGPGSSSSPPDSGGRKGPSNPGDRAGKGRGAKKESSSDDRRDGSKAGNPGNGRGKRGNPPPGGPGAGPPGGGSAVPPPVPPPLPPAVIPVNPAPPVAGAIPVAPLPAVVVPLGLPPCHLQVDITAVDGAGTQRVNKELPNVKGTLERIIKLARESRSVRCTYGPADLNGSVPLLGVSVCTSCPRIACTYCRTSFSASIAVGTFCFVCAIRAACLKDKVTGMITIKLPVDFLNPWSCDEHPNSLSLAFVRPPSIRDALMQAYRRKTQILSVPQAAMAERCGIDRKVNVFGTPMEVFRTVDERSPAPNRHGVLAAARFAAELRAIDIALKSGMPVYACGPCFSVSNHPNVVTYGRHSTWDGDEHVARSTFGAERGAFFGDLRRIDRGVVLIFDRVYHLTNAELDIIIDATRRGVLIYATHMRLPRDFPNACMYPLPEGETNFSCVESVSWVSPDGSVNTRVVGNPRIYANQRLPDNLSVVGPFNIMCVSLFMDRASACDDVRFNNADYASFDILGVPIVLPSSVISNCLSSPAGAANNLAAAIRKAYTGGTSLANEFMPHSLYTTDISEHAERWSRCRLGRGIIESTRLNMIGGGSRMRQWAMANAWTWFSTIFALLWAAACFYTRVTFPLFGIQSTRLSSILVMVACLCYFSQNIFYHGFTLTGIDTSHFMTFGTSVGWYLATVLGNVGFVGRERRYWRIIASFLTIGFTIQFCLIHLNRSHPITLVEKQRIGFEMGAGVAEWTEKLVGTYTDPQIVLYLPNLRVDDFWTRGLSLANVTRTNVFYDVYRVDVVGYAAVMDLDYTLHTMVLGILRRFYEKLVVTDFVRSMLFGEACLRLSPIGMVHSTFYSDTDFAYVLYLSLIVGWVQIVVAFVWTHRVALFRNWNGFGTFIILIGLGWMAFAALLIAAPLTMAYVACYSYYLYFSIARLIPVRAMRVLVGFALVCCWFFGLVAALLNFRTRVITSEHVVTRIIDSEGVEVVSILVLLVASASGFVAICILRFIYYVSQSPVVAASGIRVAGSLVPVIQPAQQSGRYVGIIGRSLRTATILVDRDAGVALNRNRRPIVGGVCLLRGDVGPAVMFWANGEGVGVLKRNILITAPCAVLGRSFLRYWDALVDSAIRGGDFPAAFNEVVTEWRDVLVSPDKYEHSRKFTGVKALNYHRFTQAFERGDLGHGFGVFQLGRDVLARITMFCKRENTKWKVGSKALHNVAVSLRDDASNLEFTEVMLPFTESGKPRMIAVMEPNVDLEGADALGPVFLTHAFLNLAKKTIVRTNPNFLNFDQALDSAADELADKVRGLRAVNVRVDDVIQHLTDAYLAMGHNPEMELGTHLFRRSFCSKMIIPNSAGGFSLVTAFWRLVFSVSTLCHEYGAKTPGVYLSKVRAYKQINAACPLSVKFLAAIEAYIVRHGVEEVYIPPSNDYVPVWAEGVHSPHPAYRDLWDIWNPAIPYDRIDEELDRFAAALQLISVAPSTGVWDREFGRYSFMHSLRLEPGQFPYLSQFLLPGYAGDSDDPDVGEAISRAYEVCTQGSLVNSEFLTKYLHFDGASGVRVQRRTVTIDESRGLVKNVGTCLSLIQSVSDKMRDRDGLPVVILVGAGRPKVAGLAFVGLTRGIAITIETDSYNGVQYGWDAIATGGRGTMDAGFPGWTSLRWTDLVSLDDWAALFARATHREIENMVTDYFDMTVLRYRGANRVIHEWSDPRPRDFRTMQIGNAGVFESEFMDKCLTDPCINFVMASFTTFFSARRRDPNGDRIHVHVDPFRAVDDMSCIPILLAWAAARADVVDSVTIFDDIGRASANDVMRSIYWPVVTTTAALGKDITYVLKMRGDAKEYLWGSVPRSWFGVVGDGGEMSAPHVDLHTALSADSGLFIVEPVGVRLEEGVGFIPERYLVSVGGAIPVPVQRDAVKSSHLSRAFAMAFASSSVRVPVCYGRAMRNDPLCAAVFSDVRNAVEFVTTLVVGTRSMGNTRLRVALDNWCLMNGYGWVNDCVGIFFDATSCDGSHQTDLPPMIAKLITVLAELYPGFLPEPGPVTGLFTRAWQSGNCRAELFNRLSGALSSGAPWTTIANTARMAFITLMAMVKAGVVITPPRQLRSETLLSDTAGDASFVALHTGDDSGVIIRLAKPEYSA